MQLNVTMAWLVASKQLALLGDLRKEDQEEAAPDRKTHLVPLLSAEKSEQLLHAACFRARNAKPSAFCSQAS